jgi:exosortase
VSSADRAEEPQQAAPTPSKLPVWAAPAAVGLLLVLLFLPIIQIRAHFYLESPRYSHCVLLPLVSAIWVWDRWASIESTVRSQSKGGLTLLVFAVLLAVYGRTVNMNLLQHAALLIALPATVWALWGARWVRALAFPLGYLLLTVPLLKTWDDRLTLPLQRVATVVSERFFDMLGWVVVRQGNVLQLPGLKLLVEDQCSGVHSLYSLVALSVAWAAFVPRPAWLRIVLVLSVFPIAIAANAIRVIATGVLAYKVDPSYAEGVSHQTAGMIVFAIGVVLMLLVDWCLKPDAPESVDDDVVV